MAKRPVRIYGELEEIRAKKGNDSLWPQEKFKHKFKVNSQAEVYGMPDGSLSIRSKKGKKLWKMFTYGDKDGIRSDLRKKNPMYTPAIGDIVKFKQVPSHYMILKINSKSVIVAKISEPNIEYYMLKDTFKYFFHKLIDRDNG